MRPPLRYLVALLGIVTPLHAETLTLVLDGKGQVPIVIPAEPARRSGDPDFSKPAADLQELIRRISGAPLEIVTLEKWKQASAGKPAIFLGCAPAGTDAPPLINDEDSRIQSSAAGLVFAVKPTASAE